MKLTIRNLAKIRNAELKINGITLICGANDSGKSTCGKALCALVNAFTQLRERGLEIRKERLLRVVGFALDTHFNCSEEDFVEDYLCGRIKADEFIDRYAAEYNDFMGDDEPRIDLEEIDRPSLTRRVEEVRTLADSVLYGEAVQRCFSSAFNGQYVPILNGRTEEDNTTFVMEDGNRVMSVVLKRDSAALDSFDLPFRHRAWYVDDPSIVTQAFPRRIPRFFMGVRNQFGSALIGAILGGLQRDESDPVGGALDAALLKDRRTRIVRQLDRALNGGVVMDKGKGFVLRRDGWTEPLLLVNASMGIKGFSLIRVMLDACMLEEGDILVLDEPEIHLHPEWQLVYAELIVLLNKDLGVKVLLTTHSPDFIRAIQLYSQKYETFDKVCAAYLTEGDGQVSIRPVEEWDELFDRFVPMVERLDRMEAELSRGRRDDET